MNVPAQSSSNKKRPKAVGRPNAAPAGSVTNSISSIFPRQAEWLFLGLLVVIMAAQLWTSIRQLSVTTDEIVHLHASYRYLKCGDSALDSALDPEHPPLVKIVAALPLLAMHVNDPQQQSCGLPSDMDSAFRNGHDFLFANPESMLTAARISTSMFALLLLITTYFFARSLFGTPVALIAAAWMAFEPNLLGHGALVTTDVPAAFGFLLAFFALWRYVTKPTVVSMLALGVAIGIALITKFSAVILIVLLPLMALADALLSKQEERRLDLPRRMGGIAGAMLVAVVLIWGSYGFHDSSARSEAATSAPVTSAHGVPAKAVALMKELHLLPEAYLSGLQTLVSDSAGGRRAYLLGNNYLGGRWYYFPIVLAIKLTAPLLLALLLSLAAFRYWRARHRELLFLMLPTLAYMGLSATAGMNLGVRHILPVVPLLIIFGAAGMVQLPWPQIAVNTMIAVLLCAHAVTSLHAFPNYISYANELWGGPSNVYKYLTDSNADWGQALKMAHAYVEEAKPASCLMIPTRRNANADYDVACPDAISELDRNVPISPYSGTLIVSSSVVDGIIFRSGGALGMRIFQGIEPKAKLGGSAMLVYEGTFDLGPIVAYQYIQRVQTGRIRAMPEVLKTAEAAVRLDPKNSEAWFVLCQAQVNMEMENIAQPSCDMAYQTVIEDPYSTEQNRAAIIGYMTQNGLALPTARLAPR